MGRKRKAKASDREDGSDSEEESSVKKRTSRGGEKKKSFRELGKMRWISSVFVLFIIFHFPDFGSIYVYFNFIQYH